MLIRCLTQKIAIFLALMTTCGLGVVDSAKAAEDRMKQGKEIYVAQCADCHGPEGEGVEAIYPEPLIGDLSVRELSEYISGAMPEGEPEACVAKDAEAVAAYIHHEFYSIVARVRNEPPKVEFSRLTVRQYRNSVADLVNSFTWSADFKQDDQGLEAKYYNTHSRKKENLKIERIDHGINFDFGAEGPAPDRITDKKYIVEWRGSLYAPKTGLYEIVIDSANGGELWLNGGGSPLIDFRVKSGDDTEYREEIYLLEGRAYSLRLSLKKVEGDDKGAIQLKWKPPHEEEQLIPPHRLSTQWMPDWLVVETKFPPDDESVGYERGVQVSREWFDAVTLAAVEVTDKLLRDLPGMLKIDSVSQEHAEKLKQFCADFATRAFRRPLADDVRKLYVDRQFVEAPSTAAAVKRSLLAILKSPRFLYPTLGSEQQYDDYEMASWLALTLWDSLPDKSLREAAEKGKLLGSDEIDWQVDRMIKDSRAKAKVRQFFHGWLYYDHFHDLSKSSEEHPEFNAELVTDLRDSLDLFIRDVFWSDKSDYRQLLNADEIYVNGKLAKYYGLSDVDGPMFEKVTYEPEHRAGVLTHPYLMAGLAYQKETSPIHRGVFLSRSLLGRFLKPPPEAVTPTPPDLDPTMTTRERTAHQTKAINCQSCHGMINNLGFTLENFDEVGRYRKEERDKPINTTGYYINRDGQKAEFEGAEGLADFLSGSGEAHRAFIEQFFQYLTKQPIQAFGPELLPALETEFVEHDYNMQHIMKEIALRSARRYGEMQQRKLAQRGE